MVPFTREVASSIPEGYILEVIYSTYPAVVYYLGRHSKRGLVWLNRSNKSEVAGTYVYVESFSTDYQALNPYIPEGDILWD